LTHFVDATPGVREGEHALEAPSGDPAGFRAALWTARVMLLAQLAWMVALSTVVYQRGRLTWDFATFYQPIWLIAHGHLNPTDTALYSSFLPAWKVNGNWIAWPLALAVRLPGGGLWLLWMQDLAIFGCGWAAVHWVAGLARSPSWRSRFWPWAAVLLVAILFVGNPWVYSSAAFDFHFEEYAAFFSLLAAWDLYRGRTRRLWIWVALALLSHVVGSVFIVGVGLAGLVAGGSDKRRTSLLVIASGIVWFVLMSAIHADQGSPLVAAYGYLADRTSRNPTNSQMAIGAITHPTRPLGQIWNNRDNVWANLSPAGFIGILSPWAVFPALAAFAPGLLYHGYALALPSYVNFAVYPFVAVGTVLVLRWMGARRRIYARAAPVIGLGLAVLTAGWAWAYLPAYGQPYLEVPPSGARALATARQLIPGNAQVVASNIVSGRFAGREQIYALYAFPERIPLDGKTVYFVIITKPAYRAADTEAFLGEVISLGSQLLLRENGIWVLRWTPPPTVHSLIIEGASGGIPGFALPPGEAAPVTTGLPATWRLEANGKPGAVTSLAWNQNPGSYVATARLTAQRSATVRVVSPQTGQVLASRTVAGTGQPQTVSVPYIASPSLPESGGSSGFHGQGVFKLFRVQGTPSGPTRQVEVQVMNPGGSAISVYNLAIHPA
jgi:hypothetical protein